MSIVVIGSVNVDLVLRTERAPAAGETLTAYDFTTGVGGKGLNQCAAVKLQSVDRHVCMIACTGVDDYSKMCISELSRLKIDTTFVVPEENAPTGVAVIVVDDSGDNRILLSPGANSRLSRNHIDRVLSILETASIAVFQLEVPLDTVKYALQKARAAGVRTVLNPAPATDLPDEVLKEVCYLIPNETEASNLTQKPIRNIAEAMSAGSLLLSRGVQDAVIITLGDQGCIVVTKRESRHVPTPVVRAVDTTA